VVVNNFSLPSFLRSFTGKIRCRNRSNSASCIDSIVVSNLSVIFKNCSSGTFAVGNENEKKFDKYKKEKKRSRFHSVGLARLHKGHVDKSRVR